jgi:hypothetical protein
MSWPVFCFISYLHSVVWHVMFRGFSPWNSWMKDYELVVATSSLDSPARAMNVVCTGMRITMRSADL